MATLINRMLSDKLRSRVMQDLKRYSQVFAILQRPKKPDGHAEAAPDGQEGASAQADDSRAEYIDDKEMLPEKLSHGKRWNRDPIFDLTLQYTTSPAPPPDPAIAEAAMAVAMEAHKKAVERAMEAGEEPPPPPERPKERDPGVIGEAEVVPGVKDIQEASAQVVRELIDQLNSLPSFSVQVIDAIPETPTLLQIGHDEIFVRECLEEVKQSIADNNCGPKALVEWLEKHQLLVKVDVDMHCELFNESVHPNHEIKAEVQRFLSPSIAIQEDLPDGVTIRMHRIAAAGFKGAMAEKAADLRQKLLHNLASEVLERNEGIKNQFDRMKEKILSEPSNAEELAELQVRARVCVILWFRDMVSCVCVCV